MVEPQALSCFFSGQVQGVYFRVQVRDRAMQLGLCGWVRNLPDGRVQAHIEGDPRVIQKLLVWSRTALRSGRVDDIELETVEPTGFDTFSIRY